MRVCPDLRTLLGDRTTRRHSGNAAHFDRDAPFSPQSRNSGRLSKRDSGTPGVLPRLGPSFHFEDRRFSAHLHLSSNQVPAKRPSSHRLSELIRRLRG